ncbi:hypothetical protein MCEKE4_01934 [Acidimicrobiia bacterium]
MTRKWSLDRYCGGSQMVRSYVLAIFAVTAIVLGGVVVSTPVGAVVDTAVVVPSPNSGSGNDALQSVSCVSVSECVAVGYKDIDWTYKTLSMVWNGSVWSIVPSPNVGTGNNILTSVSCVSASRCVAVGYKNIDWTYKTLAMVWNGSVWSVVPSPNVGTGDNSLYSVSCVSASECVAVGYTFTGSEPDTLVMMWDGSVWSIVPSPNVGTGFDALLSVSCVSVSECVAVGYTDTGSAFETLVMVWNGSVWSIVASPNAGITYDRLDSVSCVSVSECVAVGHTVTGSDAETLAMVWNGSVWSIVPSPNVGTGSNFLYSVSCVSATGCVAVGNTSPEFGSETLVMVWNGSVWSIVPSSNAGDDGLDSVSCVSLSKCVAVGYTSPGFGSETLVLSLTGPVPPSSSTTTAPPSTTSTTVPPPTTTPSFTSVSPSRVFDTRPGEGGLRVVSKQKVGGLTELRVKVTDLSGLVPASGVGAVSLNVTVTEAGGSGFVTVYPCGSKPNASSLNYVAGQTVPNAVIAPVSAQGDVCFYSQAPVHLLADVNGWFAEGASFTSVSPSRVFDTRPGEGGLRTVSKQKVGGLTELRVKVTDLLGLVPASGVGAVSLNVTVTEAGGSGFVTVYPCGSKPNASSLNYVAGQTVPNAVIAPVSAQGDVCFYSQAPVHLLADVNGWFAEGASFTSVSPSRVFDTRPGEGGLRTVSKQKVGGLTELRVKVTDLLGLVPASGVGAVSLNVTVTEAGGSGFVTVYPCGSKPNASSLNYVAGQTVPNAVIAPVSAQGDVCFYSQAPVHLLADVNGWFAN